MPNPSHRRKAPAWVVPVAIGLALLIGIPLVVTVAPTRLSPSSTPPLWTDFASKIRHVVFLVLENHAYDNYYGTYCRTVGPYCSSSANGLPSQLCVPLSPTNASAGCVRPFPFTPVNWSLHARLPHTWNSSNAAWNNGSMNGFYTAEQSGLDPFGYYDGSTAPIYWDLAEQYALSDRFFASVLSYSLPNHWHIVAGQSPQAAVQSGTGIRSTHNNATYANDRLYLNQSNVTPSIEELLLRSSLTWKYYDFRLETYSAAITDTVNHTGSAFEYWNPLAAKALSYTPPADPHFADWSTYFDDARNGTLPSISWVIAPGYASDHPPQNSSTAQGWVGSAVDAFESSPDWSSSVLFITWDEYGGFYDHVAPPSVDGGQQLGFRVPLLAIGPYVKENYVSDSFAYFESVLHFMEWTFSLGCLAPLDCGAPLPLDMFDLAQAPRPPMEFPTNTTNASYPMALQNLSTPLAVGPFYLPTEFSRYSQADQVGVD